MEIEEELFTGEKKFTISQVVSDYDLEESAPLFHGESPKNSLQSDIFVWVLNIYKSDDCGLLMPDMSLTWPK